jgi:hypothetical protein
MGDTNVRKVPLSPEFIALRDRAHALAVGELGERLVDASLAADNELLLFGRVRADSEKELRDALDERVLFLMARKAEIGRIVDCIRGFRFSYVSENELQAAITAALEQAGFHVEREVRIPNGRLDILVGRVAVEVKLAGPTSKLERQVLRYLADDRVDGVVVVTNRMRHGLLSPATIERGVEVVVLTSWQ